MDSGVGSLEWARRTHGRLSARDRVELLLGGARRQARSMLPRFGSRAPASLDLDGYRPPDTPAARDAEEVCREASPPYLEAHCYRTHLWAVAIGLGEELDYDEEGFYIAALTHDLGLTDGFRGHDPEAACFSLDSASAAAELVERHGWEGERVEGVQEAITLHLNAHVRLSSGAEAYLLQLGAAVDVTGYRLGDVGRATRAAILASHPRQSMKKGFCELMGRELVDHPDSRPAFFTRRAGFRGMIERAPFES